MSERPLSARPRPRPAAETAEVDAALRLLLVEDQPADAAIIRRLLRKQTPADQDVDVMHVTTLSDAIAALETEGLLHCVLLDLSLPDSRGLETLSRLHIVRSDIPIIVLSGIDDEQTAKAAVALGAHSYLSKQAIANHEPLWEPIFHAILATGHRRAHTEDLVSPRGRFLLDGQHRIVRWDENCANMTGWPAQEVIGKPILPLFPTSRRAEMQALLRRKANADMPATRTEIVDPSGVPHVVSMQADLIAEGRQETSWMLRAIRGARDAHLANQILHHVHKHSRDVLLRIDLNGGIRTANPAAARVAGLPQGQLRGKPLLDLLGSANKAPVSKMLVALRKGQPDTHHLVTWPTASGPQPYTLFLAPLRDELGGLTGGSIIALPAESTGSTATAP
ncbi:MAG: PAS domain-containing protein [Oceanococcaceae bacterium]